MYGLFWFMYRNHSLPHENRNYILMYVVSILYMYHLFFFFTSDKTRPPLWIMLKHLRAGPPEMPLQNWYNCGTKYFRLTSVVRRKWKNQLYWVIKPVPHDLVRRFRFWRIKSPEQDFKCLYWRIRKTFLWDLFSCKGTYMIDWVGRIGKVMYVLSDRQYTHRIYVSNVYSMYVLSILFYVCIVYFIARLIDNTHIEYMYLMSILRKLMYVLSNRQGDVK